MKMLAACILSLALVVSLAVAQSNVRGDWKSFKSTAGFSVEYPTSWFPKGISRDRLTILSSGGGAGAIVIKRGQAMISVMEERRYTDSTLSRMIDRYTQDTNVLSRKSVHNESAGAQGCRDLQEVISREGAVPPAGVPGAVPYIINTEYFCEISRRKYVTVLRNFEGDQKQAAYQQVALRLAESLRAGE
jgi:hypothetical protein